MATFLPSSKASLALFVLCLLVNLHWMEGVKIQQKEKEELDKLLRNYDLRIRPSSSNSSAISTATVVQINPYIINIAKVDDKHMEFSLDMYFRQRWNDERLKFSDMGGTLKYLILDDHSKIWTPDVFFVSEKKGFVHDLIKPNYFARIYPNGDVLYSTRVSLTLACPMDLRWFPFDTQVCRLPIESYGWSYDDLKLEWKEVDPVGVSNTIILPFFDLVSFGTTSRLIALTTGTYSNLSLNLVFRRNVRSYLIQVFIPSCMLVIVSWITFWLDRTAITARVFVAVVTLLTLSNNAATFTASSAQVSYTKSVDWWLGICLTFQFLALIETAVVHYMHRGEQRKRGSCKAVEGGATSDDEAVAEADKSTVHLQDGNGTSTKLRLKQRATNLKTRLANVSTGSKRLDILSRVCFPLGFALFVVIYGLVNLLHHCMHTPAE